MFLVPSLRDQTCILTEGIFQFRLATLQHLMAPVLDSAG